MKDNLMVNGKEYNFFNITKLANQQNVQQLPYSLKILLENLVRNLDGDTVTEQDIKTLSSWDPTKKQQYEIAFTPARVILQDFTGVPAVVDLAAMRNAMQKLGGSAKKINPQVPVDLVIDHSVMVDNFGNNNALANNIEKEFARNQERYSFLRWGQNAFDNFRVVPPGAGIIHQVNLEYLASTVFNKDNLLYPDTLVGTDSHTTMINGLGVLGWGVGGIEAEAAMLGQPITMLIPEVIGFELKGNLPEGTTATDLVLTIVAMLRAKGVVGKFVEFFGSGLDNLPLADRATIANMAPEYGATCGIFPIDKETINFLELSGRDLEQIKIVEQYAKVQGMWRDANSPNNTKYTDTLTLDLNTISSCIAGPNRPQDRIPLKENKLYFSNLSKAQNVTLGDNTEQLDNGSVVIAAITSCTNTSNPAVMLAAGLIAKKANALGLTVKPWVKTSLAPGSKVVTDYLDKANLSCELNKLGFNTVGYGCTTCIGNSGPLPNEVANKIAQEKLTVTAVLSGNRNFEGRVHPQVKNAYLASPPLVVAFAIAGNMNIDFYNEPLGVGQNDNKVYLKDLWPSSAELQNIIQNSLNRNMFANEYNKVFDGSDEWQQLPANSDILYNWDKNSTYVQHPNFFTNMPATPNTLQDIKKAHVLALLGDSVTTDHISPAGNIAINSPAGKYLQGKGVDSKDFNSYGSRRGNHEVMVRGTFANIRLRNLLTPGKEGSSTYHFPSKLQMSIFDAAMKYQEDNIPLVILSGKEYGTGSSRDWAAKGTALLGVKAVIAKSFERIHRSNLIGMGVLPLQFANDTDIESLELHGNETFDIPSSNISPQVTINITATSPTGKITNFEALVRIDTPKELEYYQHGGILHYVLRQLAK